METQTRLSRHNKFISAEIYIYVFLYLSIILLILWGKEIHTIPKPFDNWGEYGRPYYQL